MTLLEAIVGEASSLFQQIKMHVDHILVGEPEITIDDTNPAVFLISGHFPTSVHMTQIKQFLASQGFNPVCEPYSYWKDLDEVEAELVPKIKQLYQQTGKKVSILGYSKGGLIARSIAQNHPDLIDKAIILGAPNQGTIMAFLDPTRYFTPSVDQMLPHSDYLTELNQKPPHPDVDFYSVYSINDLMVLPNRNAALPAYQNVRNILLDNVSHLGLVSKKVYPLLAELLKE
ncbi:hypothetical protein GOV03_03320 [Candidatus Woesearchaeota archaeon]|nr:hypothetical protein [Candidatus Woesearchaeota archaeon]